jgi:N-acetylglucosaminyldiphosphoundecaprenol N-acetyl-beta-D-mannosaminyltransferase
MSDALEVIEDWIKSGEHQYVCIRDVHGVMQSQRDEALRQVHNSAGLVTPDGMPLVWLSWLKGFRHVERVYGPDLMLACCQHFVTKGYRHYLYGGDEGVAERLAERLLEFFPGLKIAGMFSPPFRSVNEDEDREIVRQINLTRPDIVWVGLGTPKQERWMSAHVGRLTAPVLIGVGAAFDFHAGVKPQAPRWLQRSGFEWLFRLVVEPRRLGARYLVNNPLFVWEVLLQILGVRRHDIGDGRLD